jgi:hypothetical protein
VEAEIMLLLAGAKTPGDLTLEDLGVHPGSLQIFTVRRGLLG